MLDWIQLGEESSTEVIHWKFWMQNPLKLEKDAPRQFHTYKFFPKKIKNKFPFASLEENFVH